MPCPYKSVPVKALLLQIRAAKLEPYDAKTGMSSLRSVCVSLYLDLS